MTEDFGSTLSSFFSDDPENSNSYYNNNIELDGEHLLWWEVLKSAFEDYTFNINSSKTADKIKFNDAFDWFFNEHKSNYMGSFENVCDMFNMDPFYIRKYVIQWTKLTYNKDKKILGPKQPVYLDIRSILCK